jgi:type II secretory pathway component PulF
MPRFIYSAKSDPTKIIQGEIEAETEQEAVNKLTAMGMFPISVTSENTFSASGARFLQKIPRKDLVQFSSQLASLIGSGVQILNSINIASNQIQNKNLKIILKDVASKIRDGKSLSESLSVYPRAFPSIYTAIIGSGEVSGNLEQALARLAQFMEKEEEFRSSVASSLVYPAFILAVGAGTVAVLLGFVIPRLVGMFEDMGQMLPLPTKILIAVSQILRSYWWFIICFLCIGFFIFKRMQSSAKSRSEIDRLKLKIPLMGGIILKSEISRLSRTLALLLSSGIPVVTSLGLSLQVIDNTVIRAEVERFRGQITDGLSLSHCLAESAVFPDFVTNIISVGEETGALDKSLLRIADDYEKEVDKSLKNLSRLLEPVIILGMGLVVGFIVLSMLLPIFQINLLVR